ncbi:MAG TPA: hypothetical protein VFO79_17380, partial [Xanthomonadales bacterium]|nr:hypothetical protein [Xanthomonadales bacterium]
MSFRGWYRATPAHQTEISVHRDKWWTRDGGTVRAEVFHLDNAFQRALGGGDQDWLAPDYARPLLHFQLGLCACDVEPFGLEVRSATDCTALAIALERWLAAVARPWLERLAAPDGVVRFLEQEQHHAQLARFLAHLGRAEEAQSALHRHVDALPRNAAAGFAALREANLLTTDDEARLAHASLQHEDDYRAAVDAWLSTRR